jgi:hypothetical protein
MYACNMRCTPEVQSPPQGKGVMETLSAKQEKSHPETETETKKTNE